MFPHTPSPSPYRSAHGYGRQGPHIVIAGGGIAGLTTALALHARYDAAGASDGLVERCRAGDAEGAGPLLAGELRRQRAVLESVAHGPTGLRRARELSVEGGRVLRAVVSRRARTA
ncbi:hypothetical protein [Streptomyces sp. SR27]|uniref:hypothetical protein n=1 Tax=Streptomyces sp. SR27 TaxID=3076630 RepID=UPI003FA3C2A8